MGLIICDTHGETGFLPLVSRELAEKVCNKDLSDESEPISIKVNLYEEDNELIETLTYWTSKEFYLEQKLEGAYSITNDQEEENFDQIFDPIFKNGGICGKCFENHLKHFIK